MLATQLTKELISEGLAREIVRATQDLRKELSCEYTDRIEVGMVTDYEELNLAAHDFAEYIQGETLCTELSFEPIEGVAPHEQKLAGKLATFYVKVVSM